MVYGAFQVSLDQPATQDPILNEVPKSVWVTCRNTNDGGKFQVVLEVNGKERILFESHPKYMFLDEGIILQSSNLTWLVSPHGGSEVKYTFECGFCGLQSSDMRFVESFGIRCAACLTSYGWKTSIKIRGKQIKNPFRILYEFLWNRVGSFRNIG